MAAVKYGSPKASGLSKESVYRIAESVGAQLKYAPGQALEPLVAQLGGRIQYQDFWDLESTAAGSIQIRDEHDFEIFIAEHTGPLRDRFTIAHELGHYVLHYVLPLRQKKPTGPIQATRSGSGRVEWEANWFAAALLMPEKSFKKAFSAEEGDLIAVADKFGVSERAAEIRALVLKLQ
jgi:Zn-dependent peptidase ImmA (M78 family)